jgi:glycosyltransferase involved in cell wall biosynthesis
MRKKVLLHGPMLTRSGYGEQARFALRALRAHEHLYDIYVHPIPWGQTSWIQEDSDEHKWIDSLCHKTRDFEVGGGKYDVSIQVTIPNEFKNMAPINIGYTAGIETTRVSPAWLEACNHMNKVIVVSNHSKEVFLNSVYKAANPETGQEVALKNETPISVVNYPVRASKPAKDFELKLDYDFNFLAIAQFGPRKNLPNTIDWFMQEFKDDEVGLVLKTSMAKNCLMDKNYTVTTIKQIMAKHKDSKCKVYLLHGNMSEEELSALYQHEKIKALVTIAHGEGYGLPIFEAAHYGLPVISPAWSGQNDFLFVPQKDKKTGKVKTRGLFSKVEYTVAPVQKEAVWDGVIQEGSMWCYPEESSFKEQMRNVKKSYSKAKNRAKKLKKYLTENFTEEIMYDNFIEAMDTNTGAQAPENDDSQNIVML